MALIGSYVLSTEHHDAPLLASLRRCHYFLCHSVNCRAVLWQPTDTSHVVSFSGDNARRDQDNLYELSIDRMLLNSKDRPKVDGLPVPFVELSAGTCKQLGNIAVGVVSSISCAAMDKNGKKYEL